MAKYNKYYGQLVNSDFIDKVKFKDVGLKNCSIVMRNITEQDEGCYLCLFNCYPDGALTGRTCLQLYGKNQTEPLVKFVSCSVTGRPAPTVTLTVSQQHLNLSHYHTVTVNNTDATVTVNTTAVLSGFRGDSIQVGCAVRVLSGPQKEVFTDCVCDLWFIIGLHCSVFYKVRLLFFFLSCCNICDSVCES
uniref:Immunoglobulin V-set domain-containing protein n=1 Tax=Anabas testudineus TaxID=64144 RepID=A0A3Q1K4I6_ANATE